MARATALTREVSVTLHLNALEAALVMGLVGMADTRKIAGRSAIVAAKRSVVQALMNSGLKERMTDYGVRVGRDAIVIPVEDELL